jgi:hypothetical protein
VGRITDMDSGEMDMGQRAAVCSSWNLLPPVRGACHSGGTQGLHLWAIGRHGSAKHGRQRPPNLRGIQ